MFSGTQNVQVAMRTSLSPKELAEAIGVSESSVKRWVDGGRIEALRTAGGHRRIPVQSVIRFLRETRTALVRPEALGFDDLCVSFRPAGGEDETEALFRFLTAGHAAEARGFLLSAFLSGRSVASLIDGPVRTAMARIGELWLHGSEGIFLEHRATDVCLQAIGQIRLLLPERLHVPCAVGGAPSGDPYLLPTMAAATVLEAEGFRAVNLGPETPIEILRAAAESMKSRLVWLSVSAAPRPKELAERVRELVERLSGSGASLAIGGSGAAKLNLEPHPALFVGPCLTELAAYARGRLVRGAPGEG